MKVKEFKTGQKFTAIYEPTREKLEGHIFVQKNIRGSWVYLCQDEISGYTSPCKLGHKFSWRIDMNEDGLFSDDAEEIIDVKVGAIDKALIKSFNKITNKANIPVLGGFIVIPSGENILSFGCGEVELTIQEIKAWAKIQFLIKEYIHHEVEKEEMDYIHVCL